MAATAVLFIYDPGTGKTTTDVFTEDGSGRDPYRRAKGLLDSVREDFPNAIMTIGMNEKGRALMTVANMHSLGIADYTEADALDAIRS